MTKCRVEALKTPVNTFHVSKYVLTRDVNKTVIQRAPLKGISTSVLNMLRLSFC